MHKCLEFFRDLAQRLRRIARSSLGPKEQLRTLADEVEAKAPGIRGQREPANSDAERHRSFR
jgi:hypothetical protein